MQAQFRYLKNKNKYSSSYFVVLHSNNDHQYACCVCCLNNAIALGPRLIITDVQMLSLDREPPGCCSHARVLSARQTHKGCNYRFTSVMRWDVFCNILDLSSHCLDVAKNEQQTAYCLWDICYCTL